MAASFDNNGDLELNNEHGQRENPKCLSLSNKIVNMTNVTWILFLVILILAGIYVLLVTTRTSNLKNGDCNTESATFGPTQVITSDPQHTQSIHVEVQSCGGIINIDMNTTTQIKFQHDLDKGISYCTWIIKSDAKMLNLQWSNTEFPQDELLVGELTLAEEHLHCRSIKAQGNWTTNKVFTPTILHFKSSSYPKSFDFEVKLDPVTSGGTHKSQPKTYYVNKEPKGSLRINIDRPNSLLGIVSVFENNDKRELTCSDRWDFVSCCDSVEVYKIDSANGSTSCTKVPLSNLRMQMRSYRAVVMLGPIYGFCEFNWIEM